MRIPAIVTVRNLLDSGLLLNGFYIETFQSVCYGMQLGANVIELLIVEMDLTRCRGTASVVALNCLLSSMPVDMVVDNCLQGAISLPNEVEF